MSSDRDSMVKGVIKSQFIAALTMYQGAIRQSNGTLWISDAYQHQSWWVAYHGIFYADLYLSSTVEAFVPWEKHVEAFEGWNSDDPRTIKAATLPAGQSVYTQAELLDYAGRVVAKLPGAIDELDLDGPSGFFFLPFNKLELQFYNIRHIQHHAGQLIERVRQNQDEGVAWVGWNEDDDEA